jgi:hypothetical protein
MEDTPVPTEALDTEAVEGRPVLPAVLTVCEAQRYQGIHLESRSSS